MEHRNHQGKGFLRASLIVVLSLALLAPGLVAKERRGAQLVVTKKDGAVFEGELLAVRGIDLIMINETGSVDFTASLKEVSTITIVKRSKFLKGLLIGALIGGVSGAVYGAAATKPDPNSWFVRTRGEAASLCGTLLGGVGALVGGLIGAGAGVNEKIEITSADPISIGKVVAQLRPLARDRS